MTRAIAALFLLLSLFSRIPVYAQTGTAEIWGRVEDASGQIVARVAVTVTNVDTGASRHVVTDDSGRFAAPALPPGPYEVTALHDGYAGRRQEGIVLLPGQRLAIDMHLRLAPLPETIALNPNPPIMETARANASAIVADKEIQDLPNLNGRYLRLAELTPAVTRDAETGGLSVMGLPSAQTRVVIDGFDHTSSLTGEPAGRDGSAVQAFRINANGSPAEIGRAGAAVIDVVSKAGANTLRGSGHEFLGYRAPGNPPSQSNQYGAVIGGAIARDSNFFLLSYEGLRRTDPSSASRRQDLILARTDHRYAGQQLTLRYLDQHFADTAAVRNRSGAGSLASAFGGTFVNEARAQYLESRDTEDLSHRFVSRRIQVADSVSLVAGGHSLKAGADLLRDRNAAQFPGEAAVDANVDRYSAFVQDGWRAARSLTLDVGVRYDLQLFADGGRSLVPQVAAEGFGSAIGRDRANWAPRVGMAWAPGERRHMFRAAYGLFYGATPAIISALAETYSGVSGTRTSIAVVDPGFKSSRVHQASVGWEMEKYRSGTFGVEYLFARGDRLPRPIDINVGGRFAGVDRVVSFGSGGQSTYNGAAVHLRARVLQMFYTAAYTISKVNETPQEPIGSIFSGPGDRRVIGTARAWDIRAPGNNDQRHRLAAGVTYDTPLLASAGHGLRNALLASWQLGMVYTLQSGQPYSAYTDGDINADRNAVNDLAPGTARNQYRLPWRISFDPRVTRRFGMGGARELSLIWEAFNVTNRPNYTTVNDTLYAVNGTGLDRNPLFGRRTGQADGRTMQVAATLTF